MKKIILISSLLLFGASSVNSTQNWYAEGLRAETAGNIALAVKYYDKSANEQNLSDSMYALGRLYRDAYSDSETSLEWFIKSAELGNPFAQLELGLFYSNANNIGVDKELAQYWLKKSFTNGAKKEAAWSLYDLSDTESEKLNWLKEAAVSGHQKAMYLLSDAYSSGLLGLDIDQDQSSYWLQSATRLEE
ncbi:tetratricopeptide repeat protein [Vibrio sp. MA40-2]|uniref:tetratricopeptide repeat protein n=1 Tax=Vibrio sp. MA40-2 TaxID=3391828 RepID=UPI0039A6F613